MQGNHVHKKEDQISYCFDLKKNHT